MAISLNGNIFATAGCRIGYNKQQQGGQLRDETKTQPKRCGKIDRNGKKILEEFNNSQMDIYFSISSTTNVRFLLIE